MVAHGFHSFAVGFMEVEHISMSEYEKLRSLRIRGTSQLSFARRHLRCFCINLFCEGHLRYLLIADPRTVGVQVMRRSENFNTWCTPAGIFEFRVKLFSFARRQNWELFVLNYNELKSYL